MTLSTPINVSNGGAGILACRRSRPGFTLVEMLVVIGIIILLIGILLPALNIAYSHSVRNRMRGDIQTISAALEVYRSDMRMYPQLDYSDKTTSPGESATPRTGSSALMNAAYPASVLLCRALIAPGNVHQDGAGTNPPGSNITNVDNPGPGFTAAPNGQVYGPYIEPSRFKLVIDPGIGGSDPNDNYIADRYGHPILYFKAFTGATPTGTQGNSPTDYVDYWSPSTGGTRPMYNLFDDQGSTTNPALCWAADPSSCSSNATTGANAANSLIRMRLMLGDRDANGVINGAEQPVTTSPYILWSAGPDEAFGPNLTQDNGAGGQITTAQGLTGGLWSSQVPNVDDARNFGQ